MNDTLLSVEGLGVCFETARGILRAVDDVSFGIRRGETFALLGESGSGKSMTALALMGLVPKPAGRIASGRVLLDGLDLIGLPEASMRAIRGRRIAMIFQEPVTSLNPVLTVGEQIAEVVRMRRGGSAAATRQKVLELLAAVGIADAGRRHDDYPHQLSGGMKQRVMIAIALAGDPELLIADEPTTALDVTIQAQVLDLLKTLQHDRGMSMLLITHDLGVVAENADRVAVMYAGQIVEQAIAGRFFSAPAHPYSRKLFESQPDIRKRSQSLAVIQGSAPAYPGQVRGCRFADRCEFAWTPCLETEPPWIRLSAGQSARCYLHDPRHAAQAASLQPAPSSASARIRPAADDGAALLGVRNLEVSFPIQKGLLRRVTGRVRAVDGVSFDISRGRTLALVGESGCGKTTTGKAILQLVRPTAGSVLFDGEDLARLATAQLRRRRADLQIIFQDPYSSMNPRMKVGEIIGEGMITLGLEPDPAARRAKTGVLMRQVGLDPAAINRYPHEFSGGQRQRICIARALAVRPRLLVCDEPTSALDISVQAQILNLLRSLQDEIGLAFLFITHNLSVVSWLADEVAVMYLGRIVEHGTVDEVLNRPAHPYTQALLAAIPVTDAGRRREVLRLPGELPSPAHPPPGCHFHQRCPQAMPECREHYPATTSLSRTHEVRCFLHGAA
jgi:peptide/nickel transport system ATP-binding protein